MLDFRQRSYLIIGGVPKAATTSLFYYLSQHPRLFPATAKETRFFLDKEFPYRFSWQFDDGIERYDLFFKGAPADSIRLEATPHYLYSQDCAERLQAALPHARLVFCLRDPINRMISAYRYHQQLRGLDNQVTFDEYAASQLAMVHDDRVTYPPSDLAMGEYSRFLTPYLDRFGTDNVHVVFFEDIAQNAQAVVESICRYAGVDPEPCDDFAYKVYNQTMDARTAYAFIYRKYGSLKGRVFRITYRFPSLQKRIVAAKHAFDRLLVRRQTTPTSAESEISEATKETLLDFYSQEFDRLKSLLGRRPPWPMFDAKTT